MDDFVAFLREHGGLQGLARELGQDDLTARVFEPAANDDEPPKRACLVQRILELARGSRR